MTRPSASGPSANGPSGSGPSGIGAVLERMVFEPDFRSRVADDRESALAGVQLDDLDREILAVHIGETGAPCDRAPRPSRSAVLGFLDDFVAGGGLVSLGISPRSGNRGAVRSAS